jgi:hypothetical protein
MTKVIPYQPGHIDFMVLRDCFSGEGVEEALREMRTTDYLEMRTVVINNMPAAIVGVYNPRDGYATTFAAITDLIQSEPIAFHKTVIALLGEQILKRKLRRVEITVKHDFEQGKKWAESLGFEQEGLLRKYGPNGEDYFMYARVI